jgi:DNA-binding XRE family transcriptional regulator
MFLVEQQRLAEAAGISRQALYAIYSGKSRPSAETAMALAQSFGITVEDLYAEPEQCLAAAIPHLHDAPITIEIGMEPVDVVTGKVTPLKKPRA